MPEPGVRLRNVYDPQSKEPYRLSRSKIELFIECARCFYLDRRLGISRPSGPAFALNLAVDALLKREFDLYRKKGEPHPIMKLYGIPAVPFEHRDLATWRENFKGIEYHHKQTNFIVTGAPDDLWMGEDGKLIVVDYKATSTLATISMEDDSRQRYKRQLEVYQWLLRQNGFSVSDTGYFIYVNADKEKQTFDQNLEFSLQVFPYVGSDVWIADALEEIHLCLNQGTPPPPHPGCEWCRYRKASKGLEQA